MAVTRERVDGKRRLLVTRTVEAPIDTLWDILTDTERWPEWGPSVRGVESTDRYVQTGTTGRVETPLGISLPFEITHCEPYRWTWTVARIPATGHRIDTLDDGKCRVVFELSPLAVGYAPVCERALRRIEALATRS